ncbi:MAG: hypothetical protein WKG01_36715 [Kofleriaceae bacterium]
MTNCHVCQKAVDPLRARSVGVRAGKVVAYCSAECAAAAETGPVSSVTPTLSIGPGVNPGPSTSGPVAAPKSAAPRASRDDYESGPVIEIIHEPVSGVVTSARDPRDDASGSMPAVPPDPLIKLDKKGKAKSAQPRTSEQATAMSGERTSSTQNATVKAKASDSQVITSAEPGTPRPATAVDDAPQRPGARTQRRRKDSIDAKAAWDWVDEEPAELGKRDRADPRRSRSSSVIITLVVLALVVAGGYLVYRYVTERGAQDQSAADPAVQGATVADGQTAIDASAPEVGSDLASAVERSIATLRRFLGSKSVRVQREAAASLARTGDTEAIETLAKLLETERIGQITLAYYLARSGDARGVSYLVKATRSADRSDKLEAAAKLASLGDKRGADPLASYLTVKQHKFDAAKNLAMLRDPRAIAFLKQIRTNDKATADDKARAAIALALAGDREVAPDVHALLAGRNNQEAAAALVALADPAARPVLVAQLQSPQNQIEAAQLLRKLEPSLDAWPIVEPLVAQLGAADPDGKQDVNKTNKDVNQISIAGTILLLAGPPHWADKP